MKKNYTYTFSLLLILLLSTSSCKNKKINKNFDSNQPYIPQNIVSVIPKEEIQIEENSAPTTKELLDLCKDFVPSNKIDIDLTKMSSTMIFSEVFNMLVMPEVYEGKNIKIKGYLAVYVSKETNERYFSIIVPDATACCQQGLPFIWTKNHNYPDDYPPFEKEITLNGKFSSMYKNGQLFTFLKVNEINF